MYDYFYLLKILLKNGVSETVFMQYFSIKCSKFLELYMRVVYIYIFRTDRFRAGEVKVFNFNPHFATRYIKIIIWKPSEVFYYCLYLYRYSNWLIKIWYLIETHKLRQILVLPFRNFWIKHSNKSKEENISNTTCKYEYRPFALMVLN